MRYVFFEKTDDYNSFMSVFNENMNDSFLDIFSTNQLKHFLYISQIKKEELVNSERDFYRAAKVRDVNRRIMAHLEERDVKDSYKLMSNIKLKALLNYLQDLKRDALGRQDFLEHVSISKRERLLIDELKIRF